jgi:vitamin B12 transporter
MSFRCLPIDALVWRVLPFCGCMIASFEGTRADDAADPSVELPQIVVGATRLPTPVQEVGTSVTIVTREEIAAKQQRTLPAALLDVPGLNVVQTGGPGGLTSVFIRGTNANQTKVFIDGIEASDPSSSNGAFDYAHVLAFDLNRVEILRGPQSGLYGSDAIGGVINILTDTGEGPTRVRGSLEGGSFATFNQTAKLAGATDRLNYFFGFGHFHVGATPVTPQDLIPQGRAFNPDSYDNRTFSLRLGADLSDQVDIGFAGRAIETSLYSTSDDFLGPESLRSSTTSRQVFTRGFAHMSLFDGKFDQTLGLAYTKSDRNYRDPNAAFPIVPTLYGGDRIKLDWLGNLRVVEGHVLTLGAQREEDRVNNSGGFSARNGYTAGFAQVQSEIGGRLFNAVSLRTDANDQFGGKTTYRIAPALLIPETGTKLKASLGTGFKAPSLDQLYNNYPAFGFFGNPNLRPETSVGYDAGFEQELLPGSIAVGATYFANILSNLIDFNDTFTSYVNIGSARTYGLESFVSFVPWEGFSLRADYTYTIAKNETTQQDLLRRPRDKLSLSATLQATPALLLSATLVYVGPWRDVDRAGLRGNLIAEGYTIVNLAGTYDFAPGLSGFARIDNLFDRRYQNPVGFQRPGLGIFGGLEATFGPDNFL